MKRKFLATILALTLLLSMFPLAIVSAEEGTTLPLTTDDAVIGTLDGNDLTFADFKAITTGTVILTSDITVNSWTSIDSFNGTLDGNGHTISGLTAPMFVKTTNGIFKNLTLEGNLTVTCSGAESSVGLLANEVNGTVTVEKCVTNGSVVVKTTVKVNLGGFFGKAQNVIFNNSTNNCTIRLSKDGNTATNQTVQAGGFIGTLSGDITAIGCINNGSLSINTTGTCLVGGFIGQQSGNGTTKTITFEKCVNYAFITAPSGTGGCKAAGFISVPNQWNNTYIFKNCINYGDISAVCMAGGIIADSRGGTVLDHCFNFGKITSTSAGTSANAIAGGIVAQIYISSTANIQVLPVIRECVNYGTIDTTKNTLNNTTFAGGIVGISAINFDIFENNISMGAINSGRYASGLIGKMGVSDNKGENKSTFKNCVVFADIIGKAGEAAGIIALHQKNGNSTVDACYFVEQAGVVSIALKNTGTPTYTCAGYADNSKTVEENAKMSREELIALLAIKNLGVQSTKVNNGAFDIRFVAGLNDLNYSQSGFEIIRVEAGGTSSTTVDKFTNTVYTSLTGYDEDGNQKVYSAMDDFGCKYLSAIAVKNIPADKTVTFILRPYLLSKDGAVKTYGTTCTVTYVNGIYSAN